MSEGSFRSVTVVLIIMGIHRSDYLFISLLVNLYCFTCDGRKTIVAFFFFSFEVHACVLCFATMTHYYVRRSLLMLKCSCVGERA